MRAARNRSARGFTLVEIVVAIVIMSIISIGLVEFITNSASGYSQTALRNQLSSAGRLVIDRISMELHNALPESVRISTPLTAGQALAGEGFEGDQCLEFIPIIAATTYIDPAIRPAAYKTSFSVVDFVPGMVGRTGVYASVYPTSTADLYGASFNGLGINNEATEAIARVNVTNGVAANTDTLTYSRLANDAAYNHRFRRHSSVERLFLTEQPISYCISGSKLYRYSNYGFIPGTSPPLPLDTNANCTAGLNLCLPASTPNRVLISDQIANAGLTAFNQLEASRRRNAVVQLDFNFSENGQVVRLNHEVLLQTTP